MPSQSVSTGTQMPIVPANPGGLASSANLVNSAISSTAGGTTIGTSSGSSPVSFFGSQPVTQPNLPGSATGYIAGSTVGTFHTDDKYTGNIGTTAYTINGIVAALKNLGLIAR